MVLSVPLHQLDGRRQGTGHSDITNKDTVLKLQGRHLPISKGWKKDRVSKSGTFVFISFRTVREGMGDLAIKEH